MGEFNVTAQLLVTLSLNACYNTILAIFVRSHHLHAAYFIPVQCKKKIVHSVVGDCGRCMKDGIPVVCSHSYTSPALYAMKQLSSRRGKGCNNNIIIIVLTNRHLHSTCI